MPVDTKRVAALREYVKEAVRQCQNIETLEVLAVELFEHKDVGLELEELDEKYGKECVKLLIDLTLKHHPERFVEVSPGEWMLRERMS